MREERKRESLGRKDDFVSSHEPSYVGMKKSDSLSSYELKLTRGKKKKNWEKPKLS